MSLTEATVEDLKHTKHVMRVMDRVVGEMIWEMIEIDEKQLDFVQELGTPQTQSIIRQLHE